MSILLYTNACWTISSQIKKNTEYSRKTVLLKNAENTLDRMPKTLAHFKENVTIKEAYS